MIVELGHFALLLALVVAVTQAVVPLIGTYTRDPRLMQVAIPAGLVQFVLLLISFLALMHAYVTSDFSVLNVYQNSHTAKPLMYKISGVWANHEGSMLLWVLILALFGAAVAAFGTNLPLSLRANVLAVQSTIAVAFLLFIAFTSNPFLRVAQAPLEGKGLNPILQDPGLAFHPPLLYAGYVGFSIAFSFAIAALIDGRIDAAWARWVRPWTLAAWMFLTLGIALGSYWAYYELGWGGFWFWDPVENASLMPWLAGTALLHSALVMEKRESLKVWTILLAILTFSLSLMGTFLVRSGVLTSVHAFAVDPARGVFILAIMIAFIGGSLALFAMRAATLRQGGLFAPISREGSLVLNNILLTTACATVLIGTLYPLALEGLTGAKISVGAPYFNATFGPLMVPLMIAIPFGSQLAWKRGDLYAAAQRLSYAAGGALLLALAVFAVQFRGPWLAPLGIGLGAWVIIASLYELAARAKLGDVALSVSWARLIGLPRSTFGAVLGHVGVGVMTIGIITTTAYRVEEVLVMKPGQVLKIAGFDVRFKGAEPKAGPNYASQVGTFEIGRGGDVYARTYPEKRRYIAPRQATSEAGILSSWRGDLYTVLGDKQANGAYSVRVYFNPLVYWIWLGTLIMALGGVLSLSDRRLRIGVPKRARTLQPAAAAQAG